MIKQNVDNKHLLQKDHIEGESISVNVRSLRIDLDAEEASRIAADDNLNKVHKGSSRPAYAVAGMIWIDDSADPIWDINLYDGSEDILLNTINITDNLALKGAVYLWDTNITYAIGDIVVASDGRFYKALVSQSGNDPVSDSTNWTTAISIIDNVGSDDSTASLSAKQGKFLHDIRTDIYGSSWFEISNMQFGTDQIEDITYSESLDRYVAVGHNGKGSVSSDGAETWISTTMQVGVSNLTSVARSESLGKFVAIGDDGKGSYSTDGIGWTPIPDTTFGSSHIYAVAFSEVTGRFIMVGGAGKFAYSDDGVNWTGGTLTGGNHYAVTYSESLGRWVATGGNDGSYSDNNGVTWTVIADLNMSGVTRSAGVTFSESLGRFVVTGWIFAGNGLASYSSDGINWTSITAGFGTAHAYGVVSVAGWGFFMVRGSAGLSYSPDGITWSSLTPSFPDTMLSIVYADTLTQFVAVGLNGDGSYGFKEISESLAKRTFHATGDAPMFAVRAWVKFAGT
jgi:hypothetical protein